MSDDTPDSNDPPNSIAARLSLAVEIAEQAGKLTLRYFRHPDLQIDRKRDDSPVTIADREAEALLRQRISERFPDDAILGEELGETVGNTDFRWVLDPIDGTKSFIHGVPLYTTLVAVLQQQTPVAGVIHAPATGETVYASTGQGCWYIEANRHGVAPEPARVSGVSDLGTALVLTSDVRSHARHRQPEALDSYIKLEKMARLGRTWGDAYGYLLVATGRADVMIDPIVNLWDVAAIQPIIEEAGGRFCDWKGVATVHSGESIATNGHLAEAVLAIMGGSEPQH
jgi:histidinol phosphatase-like enzyme (inositol monophosphatase family)